MGNLSDGERLASAAGGALVSLVALRGRNPLLKLVMSGVGAALVARAYAGHCSLKAALQTEERLASGSSQGAGVAHMNAQLGETSAPAQSQAVDESSEESFPASDPPASHLPDDPPKNVEAKWAAARAAGQV